MQAGQKSIFILMSEMIKRIFRRKLLHPNMEVLNYIVLSLLGCSYSSKDLDQCQAKHAYNCTLYAQEKRTDFNFELTNNLHAAWGTKKTCDTGNSISNEPSFYHQEQHDLFRL